MIFYLFRSLVRYFTDRRDRTVSVRGPEEKKELDLSQYEIEDVEYRDLEEELPPGK